MTHPAADRLVAPRTFGRIHAIRLMGWQHPEWWSVALSLIAWFVLVSGADMTLQHVGVRRRHLSDGAGALLHTWLRWLVMVVAMMLPLVVASARAVAQRSLWARRHRAIGGFLVGYLGVWTASGSLAAAVATAIELYGPTDARAAGSAALAIAAWWQLTPAKRRALSACHRTMAIAPRGWRADRDCVRYGLRIGVPCVASCWLLMVACVLLGHSVPAMVGAGLVGAAERYEPRADQRRSCVLMLAFAAARLGISSSV